MIIVGTITNSQSKTLIVDACSRESERFAFIILFRFFVMVTRNAHQIDVRNGQHHTVTVALPPSPPSSGFTCRKRVPSVSNGRALSIVADKTKAACKSKGTLNQDASSPQQCTLDKFLRALLVL